MMWSEARMARQRINAKTVQDAFLMQAVVATVMGGKKAQTNLTNLTRRISTSD